jgi:hypothetical protein
MQATDDFAVSAPLRIIAEVNGKFMLLWREALKNHHLEVILHDVEMG